METQENKKEFIPCYSFSFEIDVDFPYSNEETKDANNLLKVVINSVYSSFENGERYVNIDIMTYENYMYLEQIIPFINKITIKRLDPTGEKLGEESWYDCKFMCDIINYTYENTNNSILHKTFKFKYFDHRISTN